VASAPGTQQATARIRFDSWSEFSRFMNQDGGSRGLFVRAAVPPPIGTELTVNFVLPDGSNLALPGRVAHRLSAEEANAMGEHPGMGVQFTHMSEEQAQRIQEIMANAESRQSMRNSSPVAQNNSTAPGVTRPTPADPVRALPPAPAAGPAARPAAAAQNAAGFAKPMNGTGAASAGTKRPIASGALSAAPHDPRLHQAASLLERGRFALAERKIAELLEDNPDLVAAKILAHVIDARRLRAQFAFEQAIERYRAVLRLDPEHREASEQLATLPHELEHSIALYQRVFGTRPG
jgi:tetratricopeptide (TPR) repeat protein